MKIYPVIVHGNKRWCLDYCADGKRFRKVYESKSGAEADMAEKKLQKAKVGEAWMALTPAERDEIFTIYNKAKDAGVSLTQLWAHWLDNKRQIISIKVREAIDRHLAAKTESGRRKIYVSSLRVFLNLFSSGCEEMRLADVATFEKVETWLRTLKNPSYRATAINRLSSFFSWCVQRNWIAQNPCEKIDRPTIEVKPPSVLTIGQIKTALSFTKQHNPKFLAWLVLAVFAGLRPSEIDRLTWEDINLDKKTVVVSAMNKTRQRRIVELIESAVQWLKSCKGQPIAFSLSTRRRWIRAMRDHLEMKSWPADILRHTAASHLTHYYESAEKAALMLGNSPGMLHRHYRNLVNDEDNKAWVEITP